jgi:hypothetical protein
MLAFGSRRAATCSSNDGRVPSLTPRRIHAPSRDIHARHGMARLGDRPPATPVLVTSIPIVDGVLDHYATALGHDFIGTGTTCTAS